ncbi:MAG: hypothetical protein Q8L64_00720 [bacterium]|nr:hypothetical protein [bacterium]
MDLFDLLKDILPPQLSISLTITFTVYIALKAFQKYRSNWLTAIDLETIFLTRIMIIVFLLLYPALQNYASLKTSSKLLLELVISYRWALIFYLAFEAGLYLLRYYIRRKTVLPAGYVQACYSAIIQCQDSDGGGIKVKNEIHAPVQLWTTAQSLYGLIKTINDVQLIPHIRKIIHYYERALVEEPTIWSTSKSPNIVVSGWALISMIEFYSTKSYREIFESEAVNIHKWIVDGLNSIVLLQLHNGGWATMGNEEADLRIFPTSVSVWALSIAVRDRESLNLNQEQVADLYKAILQGVNNLKISYNKELGVWDSNPNRNWVQKNNALTLLTYGILMKVEQIVVKYGNSYESQKLLNELTPWLNSQYEQIMGHVDHCLGRDINDNEADAPFDDLMSTPEGSKAPVTYYDWIYCAYLALRASRLSKRSTIRDAVREKQIIDVLVKHREWLPNWYTYKTALILIASSIDEKSPYQL